LGGAVAPFVAGKNGIINGGFDIWQRGTSVATSGTSVKNYTADQWNLYRGALAAGATVTRQDTNDTTNLPNIQYCARVQRNSGNTGTERIGFEYTLETINSIPFVGKTVTFSFYARKGADYSSASSILPFTLVQGTGTDQSVANAGFTGATAVAAGNATLTTTWQRFTATGTVATTTKEIGISFVNTPVGTAGAADFYEITGVQVEQGSVATPFARAGGSIGGELALCQRYYFRSSSSASNLYAYMAPAGSSSSTTSTGIVSVFPVPMRTIPTSVDFANLALTDNATNFAVSTLTINTATGSNLGVTLITTSTGLTASRFYFIVANNSASAFLGLSAEL
jgi:hypothetical protein